MNFTQMHERLRLELLRRIRRGTLSVSLLARQTGFGQSHMSNFLRSRRQLSLQALDKVLFSQHISPWDLLPVDYTRGDDLDPGNGDAVPLVSHAAALFQPLIRRSVVRTMLQLPPGVLNTVRPRPASNRQSWHRFVAVSVPGADAAAMEPLIFADALIVIDRRYTSLVDCRPNRQNVYAVRNGNRLLLRYADFVANRLVLRPHNRAFPVDVVELPPGGTPADMIAGRVVLVSNQL